MAVFDRAAVLNTVWMLVFGSEFFVHFIKQKAFEKAKQSKKENEAANMQTQTGTKT